MMTETEQINDGNTRW